ncbi:MAG: ABC transporter ATP-binding protein [Eubacterium sp.]
MSVLRLENMGFAYSKTDKMVLKNINYDFESGKIYAITGKSGAGKTTLLSVLSGLCEPTEGKIYVDNIDITKMNKYDYRSKEVGVVFQSFNLLPKLTAIENVLLSMDIAKIKNKEKKHCALDLLKKVGLNEDEANRRVLKLSGGQQQRVAIARAISYNPRIILADEPTGNLDVETQNEIMQIFKELAYNEGKCIIIVTHSPDVAKTADVVIPLSNRNRSA